jgi:hypothetical protein
MLSAQFYVLHALLGMFNLLEANQTVLHVLPVSLLFRVIPPARFVLRANLQIRLDFLVVLTAPLVSTRLWLDKASAHLARQERITTILANANVSPVCPERFRTPQTPRPVWSATRPSISRTPPSLPAWIVQLENFPQAPAIAIFAFLAASKTPQVKQTVSTVLLALIRPFRAVPLVFRAEIHRSGMFKFFGGKHCRFPRGLLI